VQDTLGEKLGTTECEVGILKCSGKIKKREVDTMSDLVGKIKRRAMKP